MPRKLKNARVKELRKLLEFVEAYNDLHFALEHTDGDGTKIKVAKTVTKDILKKDMIAITKMKEFIKASEDLQELIEES